MKLIFPAPAPSCFLAVTETMGTQRKKKRLGLPHFIDSCMINDTARVFCVCMSLCICVCDRMMNDSIEVGAKAKAEPKKRINWHKMLS